MVQLAQTASAQMERNRRPCVIAEASRSCVTTLAELWAWADAITGHSLQFAVKTFRGITSSEVVLIVLIEGNTYHWPILE